MLKRLLIAAVLLGALTFAVQGGEYGTTDLLRQRARAAVLRHEIDSLKREVDSLGKVRRAVATDASTQERIAREQFGMVRGSKEVLYRFADSALPARP